METRLEDVKLRSYKQLHTLYQNEDYMVTRDKLDSNELFSRKGTIWDSYYLDDYNFLTNDEVMEDFQNYGLKTKPIYILVKRGTYRWICFDTEDELIGNSGEVNVFEVIK